MQNFGSNGLNKIWIIIYEADLWPTGKRYFSNSNCNNASIWIRAKFSSDVYFNNADVGLNQQNDITYARFQNTAGINLLGVAGDFILQKEVF